LLLLGFARAEAPTPGPVANKSAHEVVAEGNRLLRAGDAESALQAYEQARKLAPDAPEIPFVEGLAHFKAKRYEEARSAFNKAAKAKNPALANDAQYSLATCDHAQALETQEDPKAAISHLESAMQQYHGVLSNDPNHKAARDANVKAANLWKQLKQQAQQQQQQQQEGDENKDKKDDQEKKDQQKQDQNQEQKEKQDQQDQQKQESEDQQQQKNDQQKEGEEEKEQKKESGEQEQNEQTPQEESQAQQEEKASQEQAERRLREMIQAMQQRKKARPQKVEKIPVRPTDKDW